MNARARRWLVSLGGAGVVLLAGYATLGARAILVTAPVAILLVTARHDNRLGTCLPLVVLVMIVVAMMALLMFLIALDHRP
ncbi:hypothetical protein [Sphingomonas sp.]|uniref:hypothetical protein n=1 Tax=Sphingomonas sp. TaxID=28214 RepID=UPI001ECE2159|nr:hypothetical protein [Sphingomonas sp.]MBX3594069.1 hypothetical protein [Sphingomonas sp.]